MADGFELIRDTMHVLIKFQKDRINDNREKVDTSILGTQWRLTLLLVVRSCRNLNSFNLVCMSLLSASIK